MVLTHRRPHAQAKENPAPLLDLSSPLLYINTEVGARLYPNAYRARARTSSR